MIYQSKTFDEPDESGILNLIETQNCRCSHLITPAVSSLIRDLACIANVIHECDSWICTTMQRLPITTVLRFQKKIYEPTPTWGASKFHILCHTHIFQDFVAQSCLCHNNPWLYSVFATTCGSIQVLLSLSLLYLVLPLARSWKLKCAEKMAFIILR